MSGKYCINSEDYDRSETLTECQGVCLERDNCIGVAWSSYHANRKIQDPSRSGSRCYFCHDAVTSTGGGLYDMYLMPGNPQQSVFHMLAILIEQCLTDKENHNHVFYYYRKVC